MHAGRDLYHRLKKLTEASEPGLTDSYVAIGLTVVETEFFASPSLPSIGSCPEL